MSENIEAEQQFLGSLLIDNSRLAMVGDLVKPEHFAEPVHAHIYDLICKRVAKDHLASPVSLKPSLEHHEGLKSLGGLAYLARLAGASIAASHIRDYADIILDAHRRRTLNVLLQDAMNAISEGEAPETVERGLEASLAVVADRSDKKPLIRVQESVVKSIESIVSAYHGEGPAIKTGLNCIDDKIGGFYRGDLILIGGRPGMGKTALAVALATKIAQQGKATIIVSLEMTDQGLAVRIISEVSGVPYFQIRNGWVNEDQLKTIITESKAIEDLPIMFVPSHVRDLGSIHAAVKRAISIFADAGIETGAVFVDYLQLVRSSKRERIDQITEISMGLKGLALLMDIPVFALSQLNRSVESRDNKRPMLSDLRDSGQLEQDADCVIFPYRHYYYLTKNPPDFENMKGDKVAAQADYEADLAKYRNLMELHFAKQRGGPSITLNIGCDIAINRFTDLETQDDMEF